MGDHLYERRLDTIFRDCCNGGLPKLYNSVISHEITSYLRESPASGPLRGTAGQAVFWSLVTDPPRGAPSGWRRLSHGVQSCDISKKYVRDRDIIVSGESPTSGPLQGTAGQVSFLEFSHRSAAGASLRGRRGSSYIAMNSTSPPSGSG